MTDNDLDLFDLPTGSYFNPFGDEESLGIERDRWDRPLIKPPGGSWPDGKVLRWQMADGRRPYPRFSSISTSIDPAFGLAVWKLRNAVLSIARRPDLIVALRSMTYQDGREIDKIVDEALVRAKDDDRFRSALARVAAGCDIDDALTSSYDTDASNKLLAAQRGTNFHRFTTPEVLAVLGDELMNDDDDLLTDFDTAAGSLAYEMVKRELEIVNSEQFVVWDELPGAGTYDHLVRDLRTGKVHVADKKTGGLYWLSFIVQIEGYSYAQRYDPTTGARSPLHPDLDPSTGFVFHTDVPTGKTTIYEMTLDGSTALLAADVWNVNKADNIKPRIRKRSA